MLKNIENRFTQDKESLFLSEGIVRCPKSQPLGGDHPSNPMSFYLDVNDGKRKKVYCKNCFAPIIDGSRINVYTLRQNDDDIVAIELLSSNGGVLHTAVTDSSYRLR